MLEFRNVSVSCQHTPILNDISLTFRDGEITTILGPNGCGKTTLVQCLNRCFHGDRRTDILKRTGFS